MADESAVAGPHVPIIQYMRPDGRRMEGTLRVPNEDYLKRAERLMARGYRFEAEVLLGGQVSLTVADPKGEEDVAGEIVANGPGVVEAMGRLIEGAEKWIAAAAANG